MGAVMNQEQIDGIDIRGNLETIEHLAQIGMMLIDLSRREHIPTILEDIYEHAQRLTFEYAAKEDDNAISG